MFWVPGEKLSFPYACQTREMTLQLLKSWWRGNGGDEYEGRLREALTSGHMLSREVTLILDHLTLNPWLRAINNICLKRNPLQLEKLHLNRSFDL